MYKNHRLTNLLLLVSIAGTLALTSQEYIACHDDLPDEFLDLVVASQSPILPILTLYRDIHSSPLNLLKKFCFKKTNFYVTSLRC
jgi:hypothetical protein